MTSQLNLYKFNEIYNETHDYLLKYIIIKSHNINDTNDIMQETYTELWNILNKKELSGINFKSYLIGIANNKIKKHYTLLSKLKAIPLSKKGNNDLELIDTIKDELNIENLLIKEENWHKIWQYIKGKKNQDIPKVFYLYYESELSIKNIAKELNKSESYIKNLIYRTLQELQKKFGNDGDFYD